MSRREDLETVLDAAANWLNEMGEIERYYTPEEREEAQEVMDALESAIQRVADTLAARCPEKAAPPLQHRLGRCTKDANHMGLCLFEQLATESENTK